jgi:hypothetical protein
MENGKSFMLLAMKHTLIIIWLFCNSLVLTCQNNFDGTLVITDHLRNGMHLITQKDSSFINYQFESNYIKIFDYDKNDASFLAAKSTKVERAGCKLHFNDLVRVELTGRINTVSYTHLTLPTTPYV